MSHYQYNVKMSCSGCSNAVNKVLTKLDDVEKVDIDLKTQTVDVITKNNNLTYDNVLETISKTGKQVLGGKVVA